MTVICYTFTTSVPISYHFHLLMVNIEHLVACLVQEVFKVVFISQNYRVRLAERPGDVDTKYHDKLNTSWGQQETRRIWLKYFKCFPFNSKCVLPTTSPFGLVSHKVMSPRRNQIGVGEMFDILILFNRPQECPHHQDIGSVESAWKLVETFRWGEV